MMAKIKNDIDKEKIRSTLLSLASLFETGRIKRMKDISTINPTGMVAAMGMNYGSYITKCAHPEKFSIYDLLRLSTLLNIDVKLILDVVLKETSETLDLSKYHTLQAPIQ